MLSKIVTVVHNLGAIAGIQLAHAGRKASNAPPWERRKILDESNGGWRPVVSSSAIAFSEDHPIPEALNPRSHSGDINFNAKLYIWLCKISLRKALVQI
ncbi:MAG: hypothetical protein DSM106950_40645 [Stigonema ocellatum SAG 48.90 = DSM 106950]|nr:hypothetical protein [Stigonema ocellatum SAG 48.90 = DSM 106950]